MTVHLLGPGRPLDCPDPLNLGQGLLCPHLTGAPPAPKATPEPYILSHGGRSFSYFYHKTVRNKNCLYHMWKVKWTLVSSPPRQTEITPRAFTPAPPGPGPLTTLSAVSRAAHEDQTHCPLQNPKPALGSQCQGGTPRASCEPRASELIPPVTASLQPTWRVLCRETSQTEKDKHCVVSLIHRLLKKNRSQAHRNTGLGLPEAPGEAGLPASATPRAFCPSVVKNVWLPGKATRGEDGVWACAAPPSAARLPAQTRGLGPPV